MRSRAALLSFLSGTRGKWAGITWEVIGFQTRGYEEDGVFYEWEEYLLFNPYKGFRYLTNYEGHWNFVTPVESLPERRALGARPAVFFEGCLYKHFSGAQREHEFRARRISLARESRRRGAGRRFRSPAFRAFLGDHVR